MRDVGEIGENVLGQWAAQVGMTANKVQRDRTGWDFLLELPEQATRGGPDLPVDRKVSPVQCLVQVKSTDKQPGRWTVKLDNWVRLVKTPFPTFFLVLEFDGERECQRAFLVHVDEALVRKVLARVRELSVASPRIALHTKSLSFRYGIEHALETADGTGLLDAVNRHVGTLSTYVSAKQELVRTVGYEAGGDFIVAELRLPDTEQSKDFDDMMVDWSLGLVKGATIVPGAEVYDERFGIRHPDPIHVIPTQGRVEPQSIGRGSLCLRTMDQQQERTYSIDVFSSGSVKGYVAEGRHKVRIAAPFGDIFIPVANPKAMQFRLHVPPADLHIALSELRPLSDFILLADAASSSGGLEMELRWDGPPLNVVVESHEQEEDLLKLAKAIQCALQVAAQFRLPKDTSTTVNEVFTQRADLELMGTALRREMVDAPLTFSTAEPIPENEPVCVPLEIDVHIGDRILVIAVAVVGMPVPTGTSEGEFREFVLPVSSLEVCYKEAPAPGEIPALTRLEVLERVALQRSNLHVIRWLEHIQNET